MKSLIQASLVLIMSATSATALAGGKGNAECAAKKAGKLTNRNVAQASKIADRYFTNKSQWRKHEGHGKATK